MARIKKEEENNNLQQEDFYKNLAQEMGGITLDEADVCPGYIPMGNLALNYLMSGNFMAGCPVGTLAEISGESASGKSLLGTNFIKGVQIKNGLAMYLDSEHSINKSFCMKVSKVDPSKLVVTESGTLKGSFNKIHKFIRHVREEKKVPLNRHIGIVYDSISVSQSDREELEANYDLETMSASAYRDKIGLEKPGERAKVSSAEFRKLMPCVKRNNACVLFINQLRKSIGTGPYVDNSVIAGGGEAIKFYCSTRIRLYSSSHLKNQHDAVFGMKVTFKSTKTRFTSPFKTARGVYLYFDKGIEPFGGLLELLIQAGRVEALPGNGNYKILDPWANGKEIKFKAAKERNIVPLEALLSCPAVVDASSEDEILAYSNTFDDAISAENEISSEEIISESE